MSPADAPGERHSAELVFQLLDKATVTQLETLNSGASTAYGPVLLGVDADGARHVLVPIGDTLPVEDRASVGVQIAARKLAEGSRPLASPYVDVHCLQPHLSRIFATLVDDLLAEIGSADASPGAICVAVLDRWRELLRATPPPKLSRQQLAGLLAELLLLERLIELAGPRALSVWTGWESDRVDFRNAGIVAEVKASTIRDRRAFTVHGLTQLVAPNDADLLLVLSRFEPTPEGRHSVPETIERILARGVPTPELTHRLGRAGWVADQHDAGLTSRFDELETCHWAVDDSFPRLVPSMIDGGVPAGVTQLQYQVTVESDPLDAASVESALAKLAGV